MQFDFIPERCAELLKGSLEAIRIAASGAIGAAISWQFSDSKKGLRGLFCATISGLAAAHYVTPLAIEYLNIKPGMELAAGFLIGLFGLNVVESVITTIERDGLRGFIGGSKE